jgi:phosphoserine phosphatase
MGDSLNDLSLLRSSDHRVLDRPVEALRAAFPDAPLAMNLDDALVHMEAAARAESAHGGR